MVEVSELTDEKISEMKENDEVTAILDEMKL